MRTLFSNGIMVLLISLLFQGCAVFEPIGNFFSQGYQNTVAYFNAFYNASRLFDEAEEEYAESYRTYQKAIREGSTANFRVPASASQKFNSVIDKCSNILTFQAGSDYVQDALFLIARSYDYLGETVKAERKYAELLAQYPDSEYRIESVARLGGVLLLQDRTDEAQVLLEQAEEEAITEENDILPFVLERLAVLYRDAGDYDRAHEYYSRLHDLSADDEELVSALLDYARLQLETDRDEDALRIAQSVGDLSDDPFYLIDARSLEVHALRNLDRLDQALERVEETLEDFRFLQQEGPVRLMRAGILMDLEREGEAIDEFTYIDTTFTRRNPGAAAAFALGEYHLQNGRYADARSAFERASAVASSPVTADARRNSVSTTRYLGLQANYWQADSVLQAFKDSAGVEPDPRVDSMWTLSSSIMQDMGDWHYSDRGDRDSAYYWLRKSVETGSKRPAQARALFILADIAGGSDADMYGNPNEYYKRIYDEFPSSPYAGEAGTRLGLVEEQAEDPGYSMYRRAEALLEDDKPSDAVVVFDSLSMAYPSSAFAARSMFAAGWVYEYYLGEHDSASARYAAAIEAGDAEPFVKEAQTRMAALARLAPAAPEASDQQQPEAARDSSFAPLVPGDSLETGGAAPDSARVPPVLRERDDDQQPSSRPVQDDQK